jgi:phosphocarrier protein
MKIEKDLKIKNKLGLHARAAAQFVKLANRFSCEVKVSKDHTIANGKSIMGVLTLAASLGSTIHIHCVGVDADEAMAALEKLIEDKFKEE